jgi:hypothetical protein
VIMPRPGPGVGGKSIPLFRCLSCVNLLTQKEPPTGSVSESANARVDGQVLAATAGLCLIGTKRLKNGKKA